MDDRFKPERTVDRVKEQNLFGSGYAGLGVRKESMDPIGGGTTAVEIALPLF
jgi:hypothetical protein